MSEIRKVTQLLKRFGGLAHDRRGSIAIIFGLTLIPMATLAGVAVDYANVSRLNARLKAAADAAVLSAVRDYASTSNLSMAQKKGTDVFNSGLKKTAALQDATISFKDTSSGANVSLTATYSGTVKTWFGGFIQVDKVPLSGSANASYAKQLYKNFYFVVDASESMGLAATPQDISTMKTLTGGCALACHIAEGGGRSNEELAKNNNVTYRLLVIQRAIKQILDYTSTASGSPKYSKFGFYTLRKSLTPLNASKNLPKLSDDYTGLKSLVDSIDLIGYGPASWTDISSISGLAADIPASGNGSTPETAENYVFFMTDGVADVEEPGTPLISVCPGTTHCTGPFDPNLCKPFKDAGATVGVVYTTYLDVGGHYDDHVYPFVSQIKPALQSCASTNYFYEGTYADEISSGMMNMFIQAMGKVRLFQ